MNRMTKADNKLKNVLIVDDDPILCVVTSAIFKSAGAENITLAENGLKGLEHFDNAQTEIDFILCDLNMPRLDGIEFLRHLSERKYSGRIAILSGEDKSLVDIAHQLAVSHKLNIINSFSKPLNIDSLKQAISSPKFSAPKLVHSGIKEYSAEEVKTALDNDEITAFYQPKIDVMTNEVIGSEALARWYHPREGLVQPISFISVAEKNGLIERLTHAVFNNVINDVKRWKEAGVSLNTSMNIAAVSLGNLELPNELHAKVINNGLLPQDFTLEITETGILEKTKCSTEVIARLRMLGFGISIDDFGTGHSNLEQLRDYPFSEIKIDQSFIKQAKTDKFARICVETGINLARQLNLKLVAEGVEDSESWDYVAKAGIGIVQGYYIAKPMPGHVFLDWLNRRDLSCAS